MKKIFLLISILSILLFGCSKKKNNTQPVQNSQDSIKSIENTKVPTIPS